MSTYHFPSATRTTELWQELYQDAVLEFDNTKLSRRISQARSAIHDRAQEILTDPSERHPLDNALKILRALETMAARKQATSR